MGVGVGVEDSRLAGRTVEGFGMFWERPTGYLCSAQKLNKGERERERNETLTEGREWEDKGICFGIDFWTDQPDD